MLSVAQLDERIERCLSILADNPRSQVFAALADAYRKRGEFGRAFAVCKSGLKNHPDYAPAHIVMTKLYLHQGMYDEALQSLRQAEAQDGVTRASECLEAEILIGMRDFKAAEQLLDRLRVTDRGNPALKDLTAQLRAARTAATRGLREGHSDSTVDTPVRRDVVGAGVAVQSVDWASWAAALAARPHVLKCFAVELSESGTTPSAVLTEAGPGHAGVDAVSICTGLFAAIDAECRAKGAGTVDEVRVERPDGEVWCRRVQRNVIGFTGASGLSYGALRQMALEGASHVNTVKLNQ